MIQAWEILFKLDDLSKAKHDLGLVFMILRVRLDVLVVMVGASCEKERNQKEVEREK